jgi:hypothetical protein
MPQMRQARTIVRRFALFVLLGTSVAQEPKTTLPDDPLEAGKIVLQALKDRNVATLAGVVADTGINV